MPFKKKSVVTVGTKDWAVRVPRPPKNATHVRMTCVDPLAPNPSPKVATLPIQDFGCFKGVSGDFNYIRMDKKGKVHEEYDNSWYWDGCRVEGIEKLIEKDA